MPLSDSELERTAARFQARLVRAPNDLAALSGLAGALRRLGRNGEAIAVLQRAAVAHPRVPEVWFNLGNAQAAEGDRAAAAASYRHALAAKPDLGPAWFNLANVLRDQDELDAAERAYRRAVDLIPHHAPVQMNLGNLLRRLGRLDEAITCHRCALAAQPDAADAHYNLANALAEKAERGEAAQLYRAALALAPGHRDAAVKLAGLLLAEARTLSHAGDRVATIPLYREAIAHDPSLIAAYQGLSAAQHAEGDIHGAIETLREAVRRRPDNATIQSDLGTFLVMCGDIDQGIERLQEATRLDPARAKVHWNHGLALLLRGDFREGWRKNEWRWTGNPTTPERKLPQPLWLGETPLAGRTILLHAEQGLGDTIQFARYAPLVARQGARVILEVQPGLRALLAQLPDLAAVISQGDGLPPFDLHCPLMSLPLAFGTELGNIPADIPYLQAPSDRVDRWRARLPRPARPRAAIVWSGRPTHVEDRNRSIPLARLTPLLDTGWEFVSVQKGVRDADLAALRDNPGILHRGDELADFSDTAAVLAQTDLLVGVDTSVAHLAGAMGKPVLLLLPFCPDFRWLLGRDDSPWYPTVRLFRQPRIGEWDTPITRVRDDLLRRAATG